MKMNKNKEKKNSPNMHSINAYHNRGIIWAALGNAQFWGCVLEMRHISFKLSLNIFFLVWCTVREMKNRWMKINK